MGRSGKSEWDEAMLKTGHRVVSNTKKKWASRLRSTTKNANVVDSITREQILNERLEALERDNDEEENVNETELYEETENEESVHGRRKKELLKSRVSVLPVFKFAKIVFADRNQKEALGSPCYVSVSSKASLYPPRKFCSICGYPVCIGCV
ncbi:hypothetical protein WA538_002493 [Blastocystis sp. DL]